MNNLIEVNTHVAVDRPEDAETIWINVNSIKLLTKSNFLNAGSTMKLIGEDRIYTLVESISEIEEAIKNVSSTVSQN